MNKHGVNAMSIMLRMLKNKNRGYTQIANLLKLLVLLPLPLFASGDDESWTPVSSDGAGTLHSIFFADDEHGWAVSEAGVVLHTGNGGDSWIRQQSGITTVLNDVYFTDTLTGWAVGEDGTVLNTSDGGDPGTAKTTASKTR